MKNKIKNYKFGIFAERIAVWFLRFKGYKILEQRYKTYFGEIDIIAKKSNIIIFVEVKARKKDFNIEEVLSLRQVERIKRAAEFFMMKNQKLQKCDWRFDFIEVRGVFKIRHNRNLF